jgi:hypothetical protein
MKNFCGKWMALILMTILIVACSSSSQKNSSKTAIRYQPGFKVPEIPMVLNTPEQRADFLMDHYWDNFNFKDTASIHKTQVTEQAFVDFIHLLLSVPVEKATKGISVLMTKANTDAKMIQLFQGLSEKYLYDPNSLIRNEYLYCSFLESYLASNLIDDTYKIRPRKQYKIAQRNKVGTKAFDFEFALKDGSESNLYAVKAKFLLLYFHNPGCTDCKIEREKIIASPFMQKLQKEGILKVLSLYPDKDLSEWKKHYSELPQNWINGYDKKLRIKDKEVYDLRAIPSLYLLNDQKIVILKDARFEEIEAFLSNL